MIIFKSPRVDCFDAIGGLLSAGGTIIGGLLGAQSSRKASSSNVYSQQLADQAAMQRQIGSQKFNKRQNTIARRELRASQEKDRAMQREFAQHGIGWKVLDARNAGIDPLAALGNTTTFSPVARPLAGASSFPASPGSGTRSVPTDYSWVGKLGQDLSRALVKSETKDQVLHTQTMRALTEENARMEIKLKQKELLNYGSQIAVPAPMSHSQIIDGQGDAVAVIPDQVTRHQSGHGAGVHAMRTYREGPAFEDGSIPIYSAIQEQAGDAMDADLPSKARYNAREWIKLVKSWAGWKPQIKPKLAKKGYKLKWSRSYGMWTFVPKKNYHHSRTRVIDVPRDKKRLQNPTFKRFRLNY